MADARLVAPKKLARPPRLLRCTHHKPYGPLCGLSPDAPIHVREDERMRPGAHVWRHELVRRKWADQ